MNFKRLLLTAAATALMGISAPALAHHDGHGDDDHGHAAHQHSKQDKIIEAAPKPKKRRWRVSAAKSPTSISNTTTAVRTMMSKSSKTDRNTKSLSMPVPAA